MKGDDMELKKKAYDIANLSNLDVKHVSSLEKTVSEKKGKNVILVAYQENSEDE